jgi:hypothetical protein
LKKLLLTAGGTAVAGAAALVLGVGPGHADPGSGNSTLNVVGEPYAKAVAILRAQGVKATFGGSVGSDVPQAQCIVVTEKVLSASRHIQLNVDCTAEAQPQPQQPASAGTTATSGTAASGAATSGAPATQTARPTPGAPGVVTVIPKPVG